MRQFIEENLDPTQYRVQVRHFHQGNSSPAIRSTVDSSGHKYYHDYMTLARIYDRNSNMLLTEGRSYCSERDNPCRQTGRAVAVGRAMRNLAKIQEVKYG